MMLRLNNTDPKDIEWEYYLLLSCSMFKMTEIQLQIAVRNIFFSVDILQRLFSCDWYKFNDYNLGYPRTN